MCGDVLIKSILVWLLLQSYMCSMYILSISKTVPHQLMLISPPEHALILVPLAPTIKFQTHKGYVQKDAILITMQILMTNVFWLQTVLPILSSIMEMTLLIYALKNVPTIQVLSHSYPQKNVYSSVH